MSNDEIQYNRVLGIDPGTKVGYGLFDFSVSDKTPRIFGVLYGDKDYETKNEIGMLHYKQKPIYWNLLTLSEKIKGLIDNLKPDLIVIETPMLYVRRQGSVSLMKFLMHVGMIIDSVQRSGIPFILYPAPRGLNRNRLPTKDKAIKYCEVNFGEKIPKIRADAADALVLSHFIGRSINRFKQFIINPGFRKP